MSLGTFLLGLAVQFVLWPGLYGLSHFHFRRTVRRRRARGDLSNRGHYSELIAAAGVISLLAWTFLFLAPLLRD
jgi:hypothetical protein